MIIPKYKCIFIHIPRTGGSSIQNLFVDAENIKFPDIESLIAHTKKILLRGDHEYHTGGLQHLMGKYIRSEVGEEIFNSYYKFSFVRNPWDRIVSSYFSIRKKILVASLHPLNPPEEIFPLGKILDLEECSTFEKFLQTIQEKEHILWEEQYKFLYDDNGNLLVDDIFRFENLKDHVNRILEKINFLEDGDLPHETKSNHAPYPCHYTNETRELVGNLYSKDIELFGYTF